MQGIENITNRIKADAQAEIDKINAQADAQIAEINASYAAKAAKEEADILAKGEISAKERESRLVSSAQMDAKKEILSAKQKMINQAYELALDKLAKLPEADYIGLLAGLAKSASAGGGVLTFNAADKEKIGAKVAEKANALLGGGKLTVSENTAPIKGGFLFKDGAVEVNCSLETLVKTVRTDTTGEVNAILFG